MLTSAKISVIIYKYMILNKYSEFHCYRAAIEVRTSEVTIFKSELISGILHYGCLPLSLSAVPSYLRLSCKLVPVVFRKA